MKNIIIGDKRIGTEEPCFVISEIGAMYEDLNGMKELIKKSKEAGADAVKLQTYKADTIALPGAKFEFEDGRTMSQYDFFKQYEISENDHVTLFDYAKNLGIIIFSTPSHVDDVDLLDELGAPAYKTGSDDLTNYPFLEYIAEKGKPMIVSTGMSDISEVDKAVNTVRKTGNDQLILLHCTVSYPVSPKFANLNIINTLHQAFNLPVGYSDHVFGIFPSVLAASMGACVIEKHFTLDRELKRVDYQVSLEPHELQKMIEQIKLIPILKGESFKKTYPNEEKWRKNARKSITASRNIKKGETLNYDNMKIIRPGTGIHPKYMKFIIGKTVKRDLNENQIIPEDAF
jgi:N,N'-diacetyllegionaminate synthase